jgi:nucleoside-diphosphate-sugar epimerase
MPINKIVICGGSGFIGSGLVRFFADQGLHVISLSRSLFNSSIIQPNVCHIQSDFSSTSSLAQIFSNTSIVVNAVGCAHRADASPLAFIDSNVNVALNIALACGSANVPLLVHLSSISVFDLSFPSSASLSEDTVCVPNTVYGSSKLVAENVIKASLVSTDCKLVILRLPLVYAYPLVGNLAIFYSFLDRSPFLPFGQFWHPRSFLSLTNLSHAVNLLATSYIDKSVSIYLLSDSTCISVREIASTFLLMKYNSLSRLVSVDVRALSFLSRSLGLMQTFNKLYHPIVIDQSRFLARFNWSPHSSEEGFVTLSQLYLSSF